MRRASQAKRAQLQWGRRSSSTESSITLAGPAGQSSLQWGLQSSSTERRRPRRRWSRRTIASMGPSIVVDGEEGCTGRAPTDRRSASMGPSIVVDGESPWPASATPRTRRFNGAVDRRRRRMATVARASPRSELQWGRRSSSTESGHLAIGVPALEYASMGRRPSSTERRADTCHRSSTTSTCFNGPSIVVDGEPARRVPRAGRHVRASMGPSIVVDGEEIDQAEQRLARQASMGPSIVVDGENPDAVGADRLVKLQWGRRSSSTESVPELLEDSKDRPGFNGAVDRRRRRGRSARCRPTPTSSFNGAVDRRRRRGTTPAWTPSTTSCFNGAVDRRRRRDLAGDPRGAAELLLQWGRRSSSTERLNSRCSHSLTAPLQWGRRSSSTERFRSRTRHRRS